MSTYRALRAPGRAALAVLAFAFGLRSSAGEEPTQKDAPGWASLPGRTTGVLVRDAAPAMRERGYVGADDAYGFASGPGGYRWIYVPCPGPEFKESAEPLTVRTGERDAGRKTFDNVCLLDARLVSSRLKGLDRPFTLVEVGINGGLGCPATDSFVATDLRILHGVLDPNRAVEDSGRLFRKQVAEAEKVGAVARAFARWADKPPTVDQASDRQKTSEWVAVTWLPDRRVFRVEWRVEYRAAADRMESSIGIQAKPPGGYRSPRQAPSRRPAEEHVVRLTMAFEYAKGNVLARTEPLAVHGEVDEAPRAK